MKKITLAGSVTVFVIILLGLILGFYLMGYKSPMLSLIDQGLAGSEDGLQPEMSAGAIIQLMIDGIINNWWLFGLIMGVSLLTSAITGGSTIITFIATFLPMFVLLAMANLLFFPVVTDIQSSGFTIGPLGVIIAAVLNVLLMLAIIEFITGRQ
jgi:hypothetical protein